jgi:hypothetical protein
VNPKEKEKSDELGEQHQHRLPGGAGKRAERLGKCREDFTPDAVRRVALSFRSCVTRPS